MHRRRLVPRFWYSSHSEDYGRMIGAKRPCFTWNTERLSRPRNSLIGPRAGPPLIPARRRMMLWSPWQRPVRASDVRTTSTETETVSRETRSCPTHRLDILTTRGPFNDIRRGHVRNVYVDHGQPIHYEGDAGSVSRETALDETLARSTRTSSDGPTRGREGSEGFT